MKKILIGLSLVASISSYAENVKIAVYTDIGSVQEICTINQGVLFVDGERKTGLEYLGKILTLNAQSRIVLRDISIGRNSVNECDMMVLVREDGSELHVAREDENSRFVVDL